MEPSNGIEGERLSLVVSFVLFTSPDSDYAVVKGYDGQKNQVCVAGKLGKVWKGDKIVVEGHWTQHPKFGKQFAGNVPGLEPKADPTRKTFLELLAQAKILDKKFTDYIGNASLELLSKALVNPYIFLESTGTATWAIVDALAQHSGIAPDAEIRLSAGIRHTLRQGGGPALKAELLDSAGCWATPGTLLPEASKYLGLNPDQIMQGLAAKAPISLTLIQYPAVAIMDTKIANAEATIARRVEALLKDGGPVLANLPEISKALSEEQAIATWIACQQGISAITGKPGTGKTRVAAEVARVNQVLGMPVRLGAPTGKAAFRMAQTIARYNGGLPAPYSTIHRLLHCIPSASGGFDFEYNASNPLPPATYVLDESSMDDTVLMGCFLEAVGPDSRVVLLGDVNQIKPVGAGQPFQDMIESGAVPVHELTQIFRQAEGSAIAEACAIALGGEAHELFTFMRSARGAAEINYISTSDDSLIPGLVQQHYAGLGEDRIVLCPMNKHTAGSVEINQVLQRANTDGKASFKVHEDFLINEGDPVIQIKNNYGRDEEQGIFNGDMGTANLMPGPRGKGGFDLGIRFLGKSPSSPLEMYSKAQAYMELKLAYAISIHKSQGSEWESVILALPSSCGGFLTRKLLYTALSRAKKKLTIIANPLAIQRAMKYKEADKPVKTRLGWMLEQQRIQEII